MDKNKIKRSPLFYVGDKYKLISQIIHFFPNEINNFYEPFLGGGTVSLNVNAKQYFLNDIDKNLVDIHKYLYSASNDTKIFFNNLETLIINNNLSRSYKGDIVPTELKKLYKKTYYARFNKKNYENLRKQYNDSTERSPLVLYLLLIYGFNRMLRFNSKGEYNIPVGNVDLNKNVINTLKEYFKTVKKMPIKYSDMDFNDFLNIKFQKNDFVYLDPPYLITFSEYNRLWNKNSEKLLLNILDELNNRKVKFALSNVIRYKGKTNDILAKWMNRYIIHEIKSNYISYHNNSLKDIKEVLITNYG